MADIHGLDSILGEGRVKYDEPMSGHTSFKVGGPADAFVTPAADEIGKVLDFAEENDIPCTVIGNGSNLLVSDKGIRGIVIAVSSGMDDISVNEEEQTLTAGAGALLSTVSKRALDAGLTGLEFASGIPGSIGGAVVMNAGAYDGEIKDVLTKAVVYENGEVVTKELSELDLSYRHSSLMDTGAIVLSAEFKLAAGDKDAILEKMNDLNGRRRDKQPLNYPSAGSTFKRPEGYFAGKLIQDADLRGFTLGGAQVSEKHCGFVINRGDATAADIYALIRRVQDAVKENSGVTLQTEVRFLGEFE